MKRKLALLMAFMMAATLIPAQPANAASKNVMNRVVSTTSNSTLDVATGVMFVLTEDGTSITGETFQLTLSTDGAKWADYTGVSVTGATTVERKSDKTLEITTSADRVEIPMLVNLSGAPEGSQKVTLVPRSSTLTGGEYTYATVGEKDIRMRVEEKAKISRTGSKEVTIVLDEITSDAFDDSPVKLRLPKGFTWEKTDDTIAQAAINNGTDEDSRDLTITTSTANTNGQDSMFITINIVPDRTARLGDVDVSVKSGQISPSSLVVAEYVEDSVSVSVEKVLDVIAGKDIEGLYKAKVTVEENVANALLNKRYIEFTLNNAALQVDETLKLKQSSGQLVLEIDEASSDALDSTGAISSTDNEDGSSWDLVVKTASVTDEGKYELEIPFVVDSSYVGDVVLNVKGAGVTGDADNGGVDLVIAKAKAPVTVEVAGALPQVKIGLQTQAGADILIKETEVGALQDYRINKDGTTTSYAPYSIASAEPTFNIQFAKDPKVEVVESNMTLEDSKTERITVNRNDSLKNAIAIAVDRKSTDEPAVIKVSGVELTLDRTVPYGNIQLNARFGFAAVRHNIDYFTNRTVRFDYITNVTPVSEDKRITTVFTIGEKTYKEIIGGVEEEKTAEVAPYIDPAANRTMLPVRYIANAVGADVNYDPVTRVATFTKNQIVISINIDSDVMYVNGSPVQLSSKPANVEGRIFLPLVNIAQAFGLKQDQTIIWNANARTVTILPQDATEEEIAAAKN